MIKNLKQLSLTKKRIQEFDQTIAELKTSDSKLHPLLAKAQIDSLFAQRNDLVEQANQYEELASGKYAVLDVDSLADLPLALIRARISLGLTQKDLADRLGMPEQQVQRYEDTEYCSASFSKIVAISKALDLKIKEDIFLPNAEREKNLLISKLEDAGLSKQFVERRLAPRDAGFFDLDTWLKKIKYKLTAVFGWTNEQLSGDQPLSIGRDASLVARFKIPANASAAYATAYTAYAFHIARAVASVWRVPQAEICSDPEATRERIIEKYGDLSFRSLLTYVVDLGIPVLALNDNGAFHGATWRFEGKNVIALKQKSDHVSKWSFDLLHELYHASQHPDLPEFSTVELPEASEERRGSPEEIAANEFATSVLLGPNAGEFVSEALARAEGNIAWLKNSVIQVAEKHSLDVGVLAYQVANRVERITTDSGKKMNWWGCANILQVNPYNPRDLCLELLYEKLPIGNMTDIDRELVEQIFD